MIDEIFDVLDENGNMTGRVEAKKHVHDNSLWHGVAHTWIFNSNGQILLQRRHAKSGWGADKWDLSAGGHIQSGETPQQGAVREAYEELGLKLTEDQLIFVNKVKTEREGFNSLSHKTTAWNYLVKVDLDISALKLQDDETAEVKWFDPVRLINELKTSPSDFTDRKISLYKAVISKINEVKGK